MLLRNIFSLNVLVVGFSLCVADDTAAASASLITPAPAPELVKKSLQARDAITRSDFIGYYTIPGSSSYYYSVCAGTYYVERSVSGYWYGGCYSSDILSVFTECYGGNAYGLEISTDAVYAYTTTTYSSCPYSCVYDYLDSGYYTTSYFVQCASRSPYTFYRMSSVSVEAILSELTTTTPIFTTPTTTPIFTTPVTTPGPVSTGPLPVPTYKPKKKSSAGPIAGGVVGGLAILAGIAVGIWALLKKKRNSGNGNLEGQNQPVMVPQNYVPPGGPTGGAMGVAMPEKVAMSPSVTTAPASPYVEQQQQQAWVPPPQGSPPPGQQPMYGAVPPPQGSPPMQNQGYVPPPMGSPPQQNWVPPPSGSPLPNHPMYGGVSPPGSPPPTYFAPQPQQPQIPPQAHVGPPPQPYPGT